MGGLYNKIIKPKRNFQVISMTNQSSATELSIIHRFNTTKCTTFQHIPTEIIKTLIEMHIFNSLVLNAKQCSSRAGVVFRSKSLSLQQLPLLLLSLYRETREKNLFISWPPSHLQALNLSLLMLMQYLGYLFSFYLLSHMMSIWDIVNEQCTKLAHF